MIIRGEASRMLMTRLDMILITMWTMIGIMFVGMWASPEPVTVEIIEKTTYIAMPLFPDRPKPKPDPYMDKFNISESMAISVIFYADKYDIDTNIAFGLVHVESGFNRYAISKAGARGLTQLLRSTAGDYVPNPTDSLLFDVDANLDVGMLYMREMLDRFDDVPTALTAYNAGPNRVARMIRDGKRLPTHYSRTVLAVAERMAD